MGWSKQQVGQFAREIARRFPSEAWLLLVFDMRRAVVDAEVLSVVCMQQAETVKVEDIEKLRRDLHIEMGTAEEDR